MRWRMRTSGSTRPRKLPRREGTPPAERASRLRVTSGRRLELLYHLQRLGRGVGHRLDQGAAEDLDVLLVEPRPLLDRGRGFLTAQLPGALRDLPGQGALLFHQAQAGPEGVLRLLGLLDQQVAERVRVPHVAVELRQAAAVQLPERPAA